MKRLCSDCCPVLQRGNKEAQVESQEDQVAKDRANPETSMQTILFSTS